MPFLTRGGIRSKEAEPGLVPGTDKAGLKRRFIISSGVKPSTSDKPEWRSCGNPTCRAVRHMPWRRQRPIFDDTWGCTKQCLLEIVRTAVRRELGESHACIEGALHSHRIPLGLVLLAQGWITHDQLQSALKTQRISGGRIGECLVLQGGIEQVQITRGLGVQWGCPVLSAAGLDAKEMALVMPKSFIEQFGVIPLRTVSDRLLYLGFETSLDPSLALSLENMTGLKVENGILSAEEMALARRHLMKSDYVPVVSEVAADVNSLDYRIVSILLREQPVRSRLVRVHQYFWLRLWLEEGTFRKGGAVARSPEEMQDYIFQIPYSLQ